MGKRKVITPVMDWQIDSTLLNPRNTSSRRLDAATKLMDALTDTAKQANMYHIDGDEGDEVLHFQFVMIDPNVFFEMAQKLGMKHIEGMGDIQDLIDMFNNEENDDED
jgi:hypothetical protein